jgi:hypothetical protein
MPMKGTYVNEEFAATTDNLGGILVYLLNRYFGSQSHQSYYYLNTDIENYTMCIQHREHGFEVRFYKIVHLKTSKDYFSNVIVPIIGNITDHAYNPDNDRFGRLEDPNFKKIYGISMKIANSEASASTASEDDNEDVTDKFVQIEMTDNGFGIPDCKKSGLFRRDSITNHGLGLSHAKKFLEDNGGKITVASEEGKGTTFTFYIPYQSKKGNLYIAE